MIREEIVKLGRFVKACCPSQQFDKHTPDAWMLILAGLDYDDARHAVAEIVRQPLEPGQSRYVEPGHIIAGVRRIRDKRIQSMPFPQPPAGLDAGQYAQWLADTREAIASGRYQPAPVDALTPGEVGRVRALVASVTGEPNTPRTQTTEQRREIDDAAAEAERTRQLAALEAITQEDS